MRGGATEATKTLNTPIEEQINNQETEEKPDTEGEGTNKKRVETETGQEQATQQTKPVNEEEQSENQEEENENNQSENQEDEAENETEGPGKLEKKDIVEEEVAVEEPTKEEKKPNNNKPEGEVTEILNTA